MADPKSPEFRLFAERYLWAADDFDNAEEMDALRAFAAQDMETFERAAASAERQRFLAELHTVLEPYRTQAMEWNETGLRLMDELTALELRMRGEHG